MNYLDYPNLSPEQKATYKTLAILENSAHHQRLREAEATAFEENERYQAELRQQAEKFRIQREAELKVEAEAKRREAAVYFEQNLREQFFAKNPHVSESDYLSVKDELKRQAMLTNMDFGNKAEEITKNQGNYNSM
jgi:hypothetical protein